MRKVFMLLITILVLCTVPVFGEEWDKFFALCRTGTPEQINNALRENPSLINSSTPGGLTALMAACEANDDEKVIILLINSGADVKAKMFAGMTALIWAAWKSHNPEIIEVLISAGADVNDHAANGKRALDYALLNEFLATTNAIKYLETGIIPESKYSFNRFDILPVNDTDRFLTLCATGKRQEIWDAIKKQGADPNARDYFGKTALMYAAEKNLDFNALWWLYRAGANVNARDNDGQTALMYAATSNNNPKVVKVLLKAGADINSRDNAGRTALMHAARNNGNSEIIKTLTQTEGVDVNAQSNTGMTALIWAVCYSSNPEVVTELLKSGANVKLTDKGGLSAVDYAPQNENLAGTNAYRRLKFLSR